jgi:hypothetical protein
MTGGYLTTGIVGAQELIHGKSHEAGIHPNKMN